VKDLAICKFGDNNRTFTALTPKGQVWIDAYHLRDKANRILGNTYVVGPEKAEELLKALAAQSEIFVLLEIE
jgi:hypothetical protein